MNEIFAEYHFKLSKETTKAIEYEHIISKDNIYTQNTKGINIVLHPDTAECLRLTEKSDGLVHSTALRIFPKRKNGGKTAIHFGYSFKFQSEEELGDFLRELDDLFRCR
ncbi:hypothetical protein [Metabacillus idriensis]|uniref:hypothetical protein n=1 Tax=Metabacillus idriensis TaxID=324768 RepID=UPI003D2C7A6F